MKPKFVFLKSPRLYGGVLIFGFSVRLDPDEGVAFWGFDSRGNIGAWRRGLEGLKPLGAWQYRPAYRGVVANLSCPEGVPFGAGERHALLSEGLDPSLRRKRGFEENVFFLNPLRRFAHWGKTLLHRTTKKVGRWMKVLGYRLEHSW